MTILIVNCDNTKYLYLFKHHQICQSRNYIRQYNSRSHLFDHDGTKFEKSFKLENLKKIYISKVRSAELKQTTTA